MRIIGLRSVFNNKKFSVKTALPFRKNRQLIFALNLIAI